MREKYEEALVEAALRRHRRTVDPAPEGKLIEGVIVDGSDVILPGDFPLSKTIPWTFANYFHTKTRPYILAQELLFQVGEPYRRERIEESGRNLRRFFILSVARLVATRGSAPDRVVVLVVAKDQWSLRFNTEFVLDQERFDALSFSFSENNLAGRNKTFEIDYALDPGRHLVGAGYVDPRVWSSRSSLRAYVGLYLDRRRSRPEGGYVQLAFGQPLYSLGTEWAWEARFLWLEDLSRLFRGGTLNVLDLGGGESAPDVYERRRFGGSFAVTRSFGRRHKVNVSAGLRWDANRYRLPQATAELLSPAAESRFAQVRLPRSEEAGSIYVSLSAFRAEFARLKDIETFALSEDFRVGPGLTVEARYATPLLGLPSHFFELLASYSHFHQIGDDLLSYSFRLAARAQDGVWPGGGWLVNQEVFAQVRNVSPRFGPFRVHLQAQLRLRGHDLDNLRLTLGSDSGLRGFQPRAFDGNNLYLVNLELRTVALNLWTIHVGGVLFYDGGDAPKTLWQAGWHHDAGLGVRLLIPQFNRSVLRLDLAFPIEAPRSGGYVPRFSAEFGQAF